MYIDNHTHGAFGINFNYCNYDEAKFVLKELYKRSVKGICPTLIGESNENIQKQLKLFKKISGEFEDIIKIVTIAPEENIDLIDYLKDKNIKTQAGHSIAKFNNCDGVTHIFNAMNPIHHRESSIALDSLLNNDIYVEVIADLIHLSIDILKLILKTKPKNRIILISDSLPCAHYNKDIIFCNKKIDSKGKDENGTLAGSIKTLDEICLNLLEENILSYDEIEQMAFYNQIEYLRLTKEEITRLNYFK